MRKWSPEELAIPADGAFAPASPAGAGGPDFAADFVAIPGGDPLARLSAGERERARRQLAGEVERTTRAREAERLAQCEQGLRSFADSLAAAIEAETTALLQATARAAAELALAVAERIVRREAATDPLVLARAIEDLLLRLPAGAPLTVTVNPDDAAWLEGQPELCRRLRIAKVQPDRRVQRGGCTVASDRRQWDLTIDGQLATLAESVAAALAAGAPREETTGADHAALV